ncbi:MAG: tetratricopeptide (TPR) repeat protein [Rhodothermales bacterium]|jgi:tetratricopeptide (TPR) repeat protein
MKPAPPRLTPSKVLVFALVAILAVFVCVELVLAFIGVKPSGHTQDPYLGFSDQSPLFMEPSPGNWGTAENKLTWFNSQQFSMPKPEGTTRVFCLGGSTTYGRPYEDPASFPGWLREMVPAEWEIINAGGISYASYRVAILAEELIRYEPDFFVIYSGHNEFLEARTYGESPDLPRMRGLLAKSRIHSAMQQVLRPPPDTTLSAEVNTRLDNSVGPEDYVRDDEQRGRIIAHYRYNLARIIGIAESAGVRVVLVTPASNLGDCSPFKSDPLAEGQSPEAILKQDPRHALAHYQRAIRLRESGDFSGASAAFLRARDHDICPLRAPSEIGEILRGISRSHNLPLVDFESHVAEIAVDGIPGADLFVDHVHLHVDGYRELALHILPALGLPVPEPSELEEISRAVHGRIDRAAEGRAFRNLAKVMSWAGKFAEAAAPAARAVELLPHDADAQYHHGVVLGELGLHQAARDAYLRTIALAPKTILAHNNLGNSYEALNRPDDALAAYSQAIALDSGFALGHKNAGVLLARMRRLDEAIQSLQKARKLSPDDAELSFNLGLIRIVREEWELAAQCFRETLAVDAEFAAAQRRLADLQARGLIKQ